MVQLSELIKNEKEVNIIEYFISNTKKDITQKDIQKSLKISKGTIVKWMNFLVKNDIIKFKMIGLNKLYTLNNNHMIVKQLKIISILLKLNELKKINSNVFLYGSYARGDYLEDSDIDILIIGNIKKNKVISITDPISKKINKDINFQIFTELEWSKMARNDPAFFERVEKDKIPIE